ncbi:MAG: hypothetical protein ABJP48_07815 [Erythrobacter sp.]
MILEMLAAAPEALDEWNTAARDNLPMHVKIWLGLMMVNNLVAIAFLKNHVAARWIFAGFVISHLVVTVGFWGTGTPVLAGQVAMFHIIFWTPGIVMLWLRRSDIVWPSAFAIWAGFVAMFYAGSMVFDVPHTLTYLGSALG